MNVYQSIKESLMKQLKKGFPLFDIFAEEIKRTEENDDYFFIEIIPICNETMSPYHIQRTIFLSITAHTQSEKNESYLQMIDKMNDILQPIFCFENRAITIHRADSKIIDRCMLYTFELVFTDNSIKQQQLKPFEIMQELYIKEERT